MSIDINLSRIRKEISNLETEHKRSTNSVQLIAVSKKKPASDITTAIKCGQRHFGENYLQEAIDKIQTINDPEVYWHFIGPIQSNKTTTIAENFQWVHTLDRLKIARRLNDARPDVVPTLNVCIQINISGENSKSGIHPSEAADFLKAMSEYKKLKVRGLMALPAPEDSFEKQCIAFAELRILFNQLKNIESGLDTLSMGTTQDMAAAIAEGATMVRIGTAIFGERE